MDDSLQARVAAEHPRLEQVVAALTSELERQGLSAAAQRVPAHCDRHQVQTDPFDGTQSLLGEWLDPQGHRLGSVILHQGGQLFAEFDVLLPHPTRRQWFVEAVTAWGDDNTLRAELRLLPALED